MHGDRRGAVGPPHPGPPPARVTFPFAESAAARHAISDLVDALDALVRAHEDAAVGVAMTFRGAARRRFDADLAAALEAAYAERRRLLADLAALEEDALAGRRQVEAAEAARARWEAARRRWREAAAAPS